MNYIIGFFFAFFFSNSFRKDFMLRAKWFAIGAAIMYAVLEIAKNVP